MRVCVDGGSFIVFMSLCGRKFLLIDNVTK